tara:strand:+ start:90 stop:686 length:597 start_codon:yes stop_codon:yes gene_type:complete
MKKLLLTLLLSSSYTFSEANDFLPDYFFIGIGDTGGIGSGDRRTIVRTFDSSSSFIGLGFDISPNSSIQLSYNDFGGRSDTSYTAVPPYTLKTEITAFQLGFTQVVPTDSVNYYFRGGFSKDSKDFTYSSGNQPYGHSDSSDLKGYFGIGFLFPLFEQFNLFLDYTQTELSAAMIHGSSNSDLTEVSNTSLGITYRLN